MAKNYRLEALYNIFITSEMRALTEELESTGRYDDADEVAKINRRLREICGAVK